MSRILCRYNDKATYWLLIIAIVICFLITLSVFLYFYIIYTEYITELQNCAINKNFKCVIDLNIEKDKLIYNIMSILSLCLAIIGAFLSGVFMMLYKYRNV